MPQEATAEEMNAYDEICSLPCSSLRRRRRGGGPTGPLISSDFGWNI